MKFARAARLFSTAMKTVVTTATKTVVTTATKTVVTTAMKTVVTTAMATISWLPWLWQLAAMSSCPVKLS
jgi:hypothetical protein